MDSNGDFIKKLDKRGNKSQIIYINDTMIGFQDFTGESYILSITATPDDIEGLKASVHFEPEKQSQIIRYKTDEQTRMGIYSGGKQKP